MFRYRVLLLTIVLAFIVSILPVTGVNAAPAGAGNSGPVWYLWTLSRWSGNDVVCQFYVSHQGLPTVDEVTQSCGDSLGSEWQSTPACQGENCVGLYLHTAGQTTLEDVNANIAGMISIWLQLDGCEPYDGGSKCSTQPTLVFKGEQPIENQPINSIEGKIANEKFSCSGATCYRELSVTPPSGVDIIFWATTAQEQESQKFTARIRVIELTKGDGIPGPYRVDILSTQWQGAPLPACAEVWQAFPPINGVPQWLSTSASPIEMETNAPLTLLAGKLISRGVVNADSCPNGGLLFNGAANTCGLEIARPLVNKYQNQFDNEIWKVSQRLNMPAWLIKYLFQQETQFWSASRGSYGEHGLGQLSELGSDTLLLWSPEFYWGFCSNVLSDNVCSRGYLGLSPEYQALLRGAVLQTVDSTCVECEQGVDWGQAQASVPIFAQAIKANCEQVGQMVQNITGQPAGLASDYESLWRITLANYNVGPGCVGEAINLSWREQKRLDWPTVAANLDPYCAGAINYVQQIEP